MLRRLTVLLAMLMTLCFILPETADAGRRKRRRRAKISKKEKRKKRKRRRRRRRRKKKPEVPTPPAPEARPAVPAPATPATPAPASTPGTPATPGAPAAPAAPAMDPAKIAAKAKATALLKEGNRKLDAGIYLEALRLFQKAFSIYPSPLLHFNIAQTYNELGKFLDALAHYELFVKKIKDKERRKSLLKIAHKRIFALLGKIATVEIVSNVIEASVTADGENVGQTPLKKAIRFMPGAHAVVLTKGGYVKKVVDIKLKAGQSKTVRVKLLTEDEHARNLKVVKTLEEKKKRLQENLRREREEAARKTRLKRRAFFISGLSGIGVGGALMLVGGILGIVGEMESRKVEKADPGTPWNDYKKHYNNADTFRNVMYYTLPIGGALAVAGGVLLGLSFRVKEAPIKPEEKRQPPAPATSIIPVVGPSHTGVMVRVDF